MKKCVFFQWIFQIAVAALAVTLLPGSALARGGPAMFMAGLVHFYAIMFYLILGTGAAAMLVGYRFRHSLWQALLAGALFGMVTELCLLLILGWLSTRLYFEMLWYFAVLSAFGAGFVAVSHRFRHSLWQTTLAELCLVLVMALYLSVSQMGGLSSCCLRRSTMAGAPISAAILDTLSVTIPKVCSSLPFSA